MPTYEYKCENCNEVFEEFQSITDQPIEKCPKCGGKVQRLISAGSGLIFKGSGFYLTDYKKSNASPTSSNGESKAGKSEKGPNTTSDKTAASKKEKETK